MNNETRDELTKTIIIASAIALAFATISVLDKYLDKGGNPPKQETKCGK